MEKRSGMVLVVVLWVLVVLAVLVVGLAQDTRLDNAVRATAGERVTARWLARAGVHRALSVLDNDNNETDSAADAWYDNKEVFKNVELSGGTFSVYADRFKIENRSAYGLTDEAARLNINTASYEALTQLAGLTDITAQAIVEWREEHNDTIVPDKTEPPAHDDFAQRYGRGNELFDTVRQLALVPGITRQTLLGEDANLNGVIENNENDGAALDPPDNRDGVLDRGLLSYLTVYSYELNRDGRGIKRININQANAKTMITELELLDEQADWIIAHRGTGYKNIAELMADDGSAETEVVVPSKTDPAPPESAEGRPRHKVLIRPDAKTFRRIADRITVTDEAVIAGRININTAPAQVLATLPDISTPLAERIVTHRTPSLEGFGNIAELLDVEGLTIRQFKELAKLVTVRSNAFTIHSCGWASSSGLSHYVETVVVRDAEGRLSILYWKESRGD